MGRPPTKSTKALIKAKFTAEAKFWKSKVGREVWLRTQVDKLIDKIDPLEAVSVIATTFVVYDLIKSSDELLVAARNNTIKGLWAFLDLTTSDIFNPLYEWIFTSMETKLTAEQEAQLKKIRESPDFIVFIKSFALAYILIKHSGQIIAGVGDLFKFIASALGILLVV